MKTEIEKMYKLVGVKKQEYGYCDADDACVYPSKSMGIECERNCPFWVTDKIDYPNFTEKKQLELIKWLMINVKDYMYDVKDNKYWFIIDDDRETKYREFSEALAELINLYWQDLTEQEKEEIRRILE